MIHTNILFMNKCPKCGSNNIEKYLYYSECQVCGYAELCKINKV